MKFSTNRKILAAGVSILITAFIVGLTPWYKAYCTYDHLWTCAKLRASIEYNYSHLIEDSSAQDAAGSRETIERAVQNACDNSELSLIDVSSDSGYCYAVDGYCREGGQFLIAVDDNNNIRVDCSFEEHDIVYTDLSEVG